MPSQNASVLLSFVMSDVTQLNLRNQNLASLVSTIVKRFFTLLTFVAKPQWLGGKSAAVGLARVDTGPGTRGRVCSLHTLFCSSLLCCPVG